MRRDVPLQCNDKTTSLLSQNNASRLGGCAGAIVKYAGVLLAIRPRRRTVSYASETTFTRTMRPPETRGQLLRVAATARRLHPAARASRPSWTHPSSVPGPVAI